MWKILLGVLVVAILYTRQLVHPIGRAHLRGPVVNLDLQVEYETVINAGLSAGVLFRDIQVSALQGRPVFPYMHTYRFISRKEV